MEKEISNGAMLGIVLIALAAIIGLGFGVFSIAKGTSNEGVTGVTEGIHSVNSSVFSEYDQKIVTGTQVISAIDKFEGKSYVILIATQATKDKSGTSSDNFDSGAGVVDSYGTAGDIPASIAYRDTSSSKQAMIVKDSTGNDINLKFIQYNARLGVDDVLGISTVSFDETCWRTTNGFLTDSYGIKMNDITKNVSKTGMMEYIPTGSRFQGYLVKDSSGTIMGIAFEQISTK